MWWLGKVSIIPSYGQVADQVLNWSPATLPREARLMYWMRPIVAILAVALVSGCSGIAKGVTEAILEQDTEDTRACYVTGPASTEMITTTTTAGVSA